MVQAPTNLIEIRLETPLEGGGGGLQPERGAGKPTTHSKYYFLFTKKSFNNHTTNPESVKPTIRASDPNKESAFEFKPHSPLWLIPQQTKQLDLKKVFPTHDRDKTGQQTPSY